MNHEETKRRLLKNPEVREAYENPPLSLAVARAVVERRRELGMTQEELAERLGSSQSQVWRIESGHANPTASTLSKLEEVLGISPQRMAEPPSKVSPREQLEQWRGMGLLIMSEEDFRIALELGESNPEHLHRLVRLIRSVELEEDESLQLVVEVVVARHDKPGGAEERSEPVSGFDLRASLSFA